jgi:hypothetical protein
MEFDFNEVDAIDKVPEAFRGMYKPGEAGKFSVDPTLTPVKEAVVGLNKALKAARAEAKAKNVDLSPLEEFGKTPEEIKAAVLAKTKELQDQLAQGKDAKLNLDKVRQELAEAHGKELKKATTRGEALQKQLYSLMVDNAATSAVVELKGVPDLLLPFIRNQVRVTETDGEFRVFVVDAQGDQRYSGVTGQPMTIKELVAEMRGNEKFGRLFEAEEKKGAGTPPGKKSAPGPGAGNENRSSVSKIAAGLSKGVRRGT